MTLKCILDDKIVDNVTRRLQCQCPVCPDATGANHISDHARDNLILDEREIDAGESVRDPTWARVDQEVNTMHKAKTSISYSYIGGVCIVRLC